MNYIYTFLFSGRGDNENDMSLSISFGRRRSIAFIIEKEYKSLEQDFVTRNIFFRFPS